MATELRYMGDAQEDDGEKWAKLTLHFRNFTKSAGSVNVTYPDDVRRALVVRIGDSEVYNRLLPAAISINKSSHKVKHGDRGKVVLKLRKLQPTRWGDRWSPKHEQGPPSWACITMETADSDRVNSPIVTLADDD